VNHSWHKSVAEGGCVPREPPGRLWRGSVTGRTIGSLGLRRPSGAPKTERLGVDDDRLRVAVVRGIRVGTAVAVVVGDGKGQHRIGVGRVRVGHRAAAHEDGRVRRDVEMTPEQAGLSDVPGSEELTA